MPTKKKKKPFIQLLIIEDDKMCYWTVSKHWIYIFFNLLRSPSSSVDIPSPQYLTLSKMKSTMSMFQYFKNLVPHNVLILKNLIPNYSSNWKSGALIF